MNIDHIYKKIVKPEFTDTVTVCSISYSSLEEKSFVACLCTNININDIIEYFLKIGLTVLKVMQTHFDVKDNSNFYIFLINYSNYEEPYKFENNYKCIDLDATRIHLQELLSI